MFEPQFIASHHLPGAYIYRRCCVPESPERSHEQDLGAAAGEEGRHNCGCMSLCSGARRGDPSDVSLHTFRHSIAVRLIRREDNRLEDAMLRLYHSSLQTTDQIYGHLRRGLKESRTTTFESLLLAPYLRNEAV